MFVSNPLMMMVWIQRNQIGHGGDLQVHLWALADEDVVYRMRECDRAEMRFWK